ncbi:hypothetical protein [Thalassoroseus pseudoceratinae]|uniref:hypothetical protein n=1 Tax=Thalassoroseus pseudoceratinae TaxID=2713176 RepID=UPI0014246596|nr:hypothetical protein [Thalassoroseus pseudoceratinae]
MSNVNTTSSKPESVGLAIFVLVAILAVAVPPFLRTPLTNDAIYYDLQARHLVDGGKLYEDMFEPNLPGVVWLHVAVRSIAGDSWEALRVFDLLMFSAAVFIAVRWIVPKGVSARSRYYLAAACFLFYFSQTTWCHCQRDVWMTVPVLGALALRIRQTERIQSGTVSNTILFGLGVLEGLVWGAGVWLKPHVVLMAGMVWILSVTMTRQWRRIAVDSAGLLVGGLIIGGAGVGWMMSVGCWSAFWETMTKWNPEYATSGQAHKTFIRYLELLYFLSPWVWLHVLAVPVACLAIRRSFRADRTDSDLPVALLSICYLTWTIQAFALQHLFHYIHVAPILLGIVVVAMSFRSRVSSLGRVGVLGFVTVAVLCSPLLRFERLGLWWPSIRSPLPVRVAERLGGATANRQLEDIDKVADFLAENEVGTRDVWCYNSELVALYDRMRLTPPTRYVYTLELLVFLPSRRQEIWQAHRNTPIRYLVANIETSLLRDQQIREVKDRARSLRTGGDMPESDIPLPYPLDSPIVYTAGNYYVFDLGTNPQTLVSDRPHATLK